MVKTNRALDWFAQAEDDLRWAVDSCKAGHYAQVCFICQQVGEKALKALAFARGAEFIKGHSITKLTQTLGIDGDILKAGKKLDLYYVSGRYPDAFPAGRPSEFLSEKDAEEAINLAKLIVDAVRAKLNEPGS